MFHRFVFFLVALGVTNVIAVGFGDISVRAQGTATCNGFGFGYGFGPSPRGNANVSIIHRRYPTGPNSKPIKELVLATVPTHQSVKGEYFVGATGEGGNFGTVVKLFLRLTYVCAGLAGVREVQVPDSAIMQGPAYPLKTFQHDFKVIFVGPGRR